jgi:hypothetical protein
MRAGEIVAAGTESELSGRLLHGTQVLVTVRADDVASARQALTLVDGVGAVTEAQPREKGPGIASFHVEAEGDVREALCRALVEAKIGLLEIVRNKRELESIFLSLTGKGEDEEEAPS